MIDIKNLQDEEKFQKFCKDLNDGVFTKEEIEQFLAYTDRFVNNLEEVLKDE